jgi:hypothetical protein
MVCEQANSCDVAPGSGTRERTVCGVVLDRDDTSTQSPMFSTNFANSKTSLLLRTINDHFRLVTLIFTIRKSLFARNIRSLIE